MPREDLDFSDKLKEAVLDAADMLCEDPEINACQDEFLLSAIRQTRDMLYECFEKTGLDGVFDPIEQKKDGLRLAVELAPDSGREKTLKNVLAIMERTILKIKLLVDIYDFQTGFNKGKEGNDQHFTLASIERFVEQVTSPKYGLSKHKFSRWLKKVYPGAGYRGLAAGAGLPVIINPYDNEEIRAKLTEDLWRTYNQKNGYPLDNRKYFTESNLPTLYEPSYDYYFFKRVWGGFSAAVDEVILGRNVPRTGANDVVSEGASLSEDGIHKCLRASLAEGFAFPKEGEKDYEKWQKIRSAVSIELRQDLKETIDYLSPDVKRIAQTGTNYVLSEPLMLARSKYLREYHASVFLLWLTEEELDTATNHRNKLIQKRLKDFFFARRNVKRVKDCLSVEFFDPPQMDLPAIQSMEYAQVKESVEQNILGHKFSPEAASPDLEKMRTALRLYAEDGLSVRIDEEIFTSPQRKGTQILKFIEEKLRFFKEHPEIPFYMRQVLLKCWQTGSDILQKKWDYFAEKAVEPRFFVHFLHYQSIATMDRLIGPLKKAPKYEAALDVYHGRVTDTAKGNIAKCTELLAPYLPVDKMPSMEILQETDPEILAKRIRARVKSGRPISPDIAGRNAARTRSSSQKLFTAAERSEKSGEEASALEELERLGYSWDSMPKMVKKHLPTAILRKIKMFLDAEVSVPDLTVLVQKDENIRKLIKTILERNAMDDRDKVEFDEFLMARDISIIPGYIATALSHGSGYRTCLAKMKQIEEGGVPFTEDCWWVVNGSEEQRQMFIERSWRLRSKDRYFLELGEIYGFPVEEIPNCIYVKRSPPTLRVYLKALEQVGHTPSGYWFHGINMNAIEMFREFIEHRLRKKAEVGKELTYKEAQWMNKRDVVAFLKEQGVKEVDVFLIDEIVEECSPTEFAELSQMQCVDDQMMGLINEVVRRLKKKDLVEDALWAARRNFADMDYFCKSEEKMDECLEKIRALKKLKAPVTGEALYLDWAEVPGLAEIFADRRLTTEQEKIRIFLENLNCNPLVVLRLSSMQDLNLDELKQNARFFQRLKLSPEVHGKRKPDVEDFEDYLEYPYSYCIHVCSHSIKRALKKAKSSNKTYVPVFKRPSGRGRRAGKTCVGA